MNQVYENPIRGRSGSAASKRRVQMAELDPGLLWGESPIGRDRTPSLDAVPQMVSEECHDPPTKRE